MSTLEQAIALAARAHAGQKDKAGQPYILHPLRVMLRVDTECDRIAPVLHDVIEDTAVTSDDLRREGFTADIIDAVVALTKQDGEPYDALIRRAAGNPIARRVKLADREDNMDPSRLRHASDGDERLVRYRRAHDELMAGDR